MFWAENIWPIWNSPTTIIRQSDCSGHNVKTIVDQELHDITDIAVDPIKHMVYWVDMVKLALERANYDGTKRNMLFYTTVSTFTCLKNKSIYLISKYYKFLN